MLSNQIYVVVISIIIVFLFYYNHNLKLKRSRQLSPNQLKLFHIGLDDVHSWIAIIMPRTVKTSIDYCEHQLLLPFTVVLASDSLPEDIVKK